MLLAPSPTPAAFSRRSLLAGASAAGLGLLAGCTSGDGAVTPQQADALAGQVTVQATLVSAYAAATQADPALAALVADLATQAQQQLERLQAAAPSPGSAASSAPPSTAPPAGTEVREWLRTQVTTTADSHASACLGQTGSRAALLGSIAAGLRGQATRLA